MVEEMCPVCLTKGVDSWLDYADGEIEGNCFVFTVDCGGDDESEGCGWSGKAWANISDDHLLSEHDGSAVVA